MVPVLFVKIAKIIMHHQLFMSLFVQGSEKYCIRFKGWLGTVVGLWHICQCFVGHRFSQHNQHQWLWKLSEGEFTSSWYTLQPNSIKQQSFSCEPSETGYKISYEYVYLDQFTRAQPHRICQPFLNSSLLYFSNFQQQNVSTMTSSSKKSR